MATAQTLLLSGDDPLSYGFHTWAEIGRPDAMTHEDLDGLFEPNPSSPSYSPGQLAYDTSSLSPDTSQAQFTPSSTLHGSFQDGENSENAALDLAAASTTSLAEDYELSPFSSNSSDYSYSSHLAMHGLESALSPSLSNETSGIILSSPLQQGWQSFTSTESNQNFSTLQLGAASSYDFNSFSAPSTSLSANYNNPTNVPLPLRSLPTTQPWIPTPAQSFTTGPSWGNIQQPTEQQQHPASFPQSFHFIPDTGASHMPVNSGPGRNVYMLTPEHSFDGQQSVLPSQTSSFAMQSQDPRPAVSSSSVRNQPLPQFEIAVSNRRHPPRTGNRKEQQGPAEPRQTTRRLAAASSSTSPASQGERGNGPSPKPGRGGRKKHSHLNEQARKRSSAMRKMGACWRCKLQRDPCPDDGSPCGRCLHVMETHKGLHIYFACDRSKLPDFVFDFLPPSYTVMHSKQNIEDCVQDQVRFWDLANPIDVYFTSGFGHPLRWTLHEFEPSTVELLAQYQYLQNTQTRQSVRFEKWSPPLGITKLEPSDDWHFKNYLDELMMDEHLTEFPFTCFEEELQFDNFQADLLALICQLYRTTFDQDLRSLLHKIIRMMMITYIMGHTLTITQETLPAVHYQLQHPNKPALPAPHTSPRLANRQLKFFFHVLRHQIFEEILKWQQATFQTAGSKDKTWLSSFLVILALAMVLEEAQRTMQTQADSKARKRECSYDGSQQEARNACERIDERFALLIGLFQCKYRDKKWVRDGSFGPQTPRLRGAIEHEFCQELRGLLLEKEHHLRTRKDVPFSSQNQCFYTSRLVARFLLPFLNLPA